MTPTLVLQFASKTDTGLVRAHNEDAIEINADYKIAVLADGMGGYNAGEVASGIAANVFTVTLEQRLQQRAEKRRPLGSKFLQGLMSESVSLANTQILEAARQQPQFSGMGTTLVAALFHHDRIVLAHIGDSRAYRFRQGALLQLTRDHSQLQEQIDAGLVSPEWARFAPNKNLITRALGVASSVDVDTDVHLMEPDDIYLLCSDGLSDMLSNEQMIALIKRNYSDLDLLCIALVDAANNNGGRDNISVILIKVQSSHVIKNSFRTRLTSWFRRS
ncbi:Stp1/IreP family PP2C-type Ser/Thr phosphatase [Herminiimonas fonticola]|uniref:Protein phosphatase n=1 Tax=Herminiimonas fonticola TaxID=303380 RepID=A0A4R6GJQ6_9BURK|nr:Stp1/IreP family PP2C-type Ser/Thr phosphatase [Herminiimonas fonticola]RBA25290.1 Serine/threonine protein phosphatase [Herminiimonas fonticola]TDN94405.1 protein phosphatase [Herminiimonas fonticola]